MTDDDFSYITSQDIAEPGRTYDPQSRAPPSMEAEQDVLLLKTKGVVHPVKFEPYSISDGKIHIGDIKDRAAIVHNLPDGSRRISLYYKGQALKDDNKLARDCSLKNNSEILCVVAEGGPVVAPANDSGDESDTIQADGTKRKRNRKTKKKSSFFGKKKADSAPSASEPAQSSQNSRPAPPPAAPMPRTGLEKIAAISSHFHTKIVPLCVQFTAHPPEDAKKRDMEHKRLSETIMNDVMLKLDGVEADGVDEIRIQRKALINEAQGVLNGLDRIMA